MVTKNKGQDEEGNTKEDGDTGNDVDEMLDFLRNRSLCFPLIKKGNIE